MIHFNAILDSICKYSLRVFFHDINEWVLGYSFIFFCAFYCGFICYKYAFEGFLFFPLLYNTLNGIKVRCFLKICQYSPSETNYVLNCFVGSKLTICPPFKMDIGMLNFQIYLGCNFLENNLNSQIYLHWIDEIGVIGVF